MSATTEATPATSEPTSQPSENRLLEVDPKRFAALSDMRKGVGEALVRFNCANEDAKAKKKIYEAARSAFEREFDRFVANVNGEDLPLFSQKDILDRAQADPVVMKLVDRLLAAGHDVNAILVAGYNQDERAQASAYLDALEARAKRLETEVLTDDDARAITVEVPAFLLPQPLTPIELADLAQRLKDKELVITTDQLASFGKAQIAEVRDYLERVAAIEQDKVASLTVSDLPEPPAFLVEADAANLEADGPDDDDEPEEAAESESEAKPKNGAKVH